MLPNIDLLHVDIFYLYLVDGLLNFIMHSFFMTQRLQLFIFCVNGLEYTANLDNNLFSFHLKHH